MKLGRSAAAAAIAALLLVGCEQRQHTTQVTPSAPPMRASDAAVAASSTADPSLPSADSASASKSAQDAAVTVYDSTKPIPNPAAETGRDGAVESTLTADERDRQMPMKGQANDYNTPDRAKEGDQPNTASKEPGGQEANPGNQTSASK